MNFDGAIFAFDLTLFTELSTAAGSTFAFFTKRTNTMFLSSFNALK
jgi:hypothetical protein